ncbi:2-hydroxyacyl-CoA dehydratase subunit D [Chloroflexota bacterium]
MSREVEATLMQLTSANSEANRKHWALSSKKRGIKVIGTVMPYVPLEIIYAAGALPWRISGWQSDIGLASAYRPTTSNPYNAQVLELLLRKELDFLDGAIISDWDIDTRRLWDDWVGQKWAPPAHIMYVPRHTSPSAYGAMAEEIAKVADFVETIVGNKITPEALAGAISTYNEIRTLIRSLYETRKMAEPPLSGAELLGITTAALVIPPEDFIQKSKSLLAGLGPRKVPGRQLEPRLLVSSDSLDNPAYLEMIEETGSLVVMDDTDTGSRCWFGLVEPTLADPMRSLAERYINFCFGPRTFSWPQQADQVIAWVKEFNVDGVIELPLSFSHPRAFRAPFFHNCLKRVGIPSISIARDYRLVNTGQLRTKVQAFLEILGGLG